MALIQSNPTEIRQLDLNQFRLELKSLEESGAGVTFPRTHRHNTTDTVGGVVLARSIIIMNGYTVTFEDGQYAVNLVGANSNVGDVVNVNQVSVRSANSAGLQDLSTLLASAYNGQVVVDSVHGQAGTQTPLGTRSTPVNNMRDAIEIAQANSIKTILLTESITLTSNDFSDGFTFLGDNASTIMLTIDPGADVTNCIFRNLKVQGTLDGDNEIRDCSVLTLNYVSGTVIDSGLLETISVASGRQANIVNCYSLVAGEQAEPVINMGVDGSLVVTNFNGNVGMENYNGGGEVSFDINSGRLRIDPSVTAGDIYVRGIAQVVDNSSALVHDYTLNSIAGAAGLSELESQQLLDLYRASALDQTAPVRINGTNPKLITAGSLSLRVSTSGDEILVERL